MVNQQKSDPYRSFDGHGIDVSSKRADDLDRMSLLYFETKDSARVLDLGCGAGGHSVRLAESGVFVTAIDSYDFSAEFSAYHQSLSVFSEYLRFIQGDIVNLVQLIGEHYYTDVYMQRTLHYLTYIQALNLLTTLHEITTDRLYISVTGIESAIGEDYKARDTEIKQRFCFLTTNKAKIFSIYEPICLYNKEEFLILLETAGWQVQQVWQSAFGNIKAICTH